MQVPPEEAVNVVPEYEQPVAVPFATDVTDDEPVPDPPVTALTVTVWLNGADLLVELKVTAVKAD